MDLKEKKVQNLNLFRDLEIVLPQLHVKCTINFSLSASFKTTKSISTVVTIKLVILICDIIFVIVIT